MALYSKEFDEFIEHMQKPATLKKFRTGVFNKSHIESHGDTSYVVSRVNKRYPVFEINALFQEVGFSDDLVQEFLVPYRYKMAISFDDNDRIVFNEFEIECRIKQNNVDGEYNNATIRSKASLGPRDIIEFVEREYNKNYHTLSEQEKTVYLLSGYRPLADELIRQLRELIATIQLISQEIERSERRIRRIALACGHWIPHWAIEGKGAFTIGCAGFFNGLATYYVVRLYFNIILMLFYIT